MEIVAIFYNKRKLYFEKILREIWENFHESLNKLWRISKEFRRIFTKISEKRKRGNFGNILEKLRGKFRIGNFYDIKISNFSENL